MKTISTVLSALLVALLPASSMADPDYDAGTDDDQFFGAGEEATQDNNSSGPRPPAEDAGDQDLGGTYHQEPACATICTGALTCPDGEIATHAWIEGPNGEILWDWTGCPDDTPTVPSEPAEPTIDSIVRAFRRVQVPASPLVIQPPNGRTLVNFETNFYTRDRTIIREITLLGRPVRFRITASQYIWRFGDGESMTTREAGAPYPQLTITHNYRRTGRYAPSLDTVYVADYRVGGGPWQEVPGSVTVEGEPASLRAIEATPTLVGYGG